MDQHRAAEIVTENMKTIFAYSLSRVSNHDDAEDLASNIMVEVLSGALKIHDDDAFYGYMWAIARNTYKKFLSHRRKNLTVAIDDYENLAVDSVTDELFDMDEIYLLRRELSLLSREYRECTVAYYFNGSSCAEVSKQLGISLEMVKYYLFKTRKILKEGIGMTREMGEKSYKPGKFIFMTLLDGGPNLQYAQLFRRKLPGNILLSAYYTPVTIRELSIELGVSTVYLEDELELLEKYNMLKKVTDSKYQTNIIILTEAYEKEMFSQAEPICFNDFKAIIQKLQSLLPMVRQFDFHGKNFDDNRLIWALYIAVIFNSWWKFDDVNKVKIGEHPELYPGTRGVIYGSDYDNSNSPYGSTAMAGGVVSEDGMARYVFANSTILGKSAVTRYNREVFDVIKAIPSNGSEKQQKIIDEKYASVIDDHLSAEFPVFDHDVLEQVKEILAPVFIDMMNIYEKIAAISTSVLRAHAPKAVAGQIESLVYYTMLPRIMGFLEAEAVKAGGLIVPESGEKVAIFGVIEKP